MSDHRLPVAERQGVATPLWLATASALLLAMSWMSGCTPTAAPEAAVGVGEEAEATESAPQPTITSFAVKITAAPEATAADQQVNASDRMHLASCGGMPCPYKGSNDAPVTVIELTDYQCRYCREFLDEIVPAILAEYVDSGQVRFVSHFLVWNPEMQPIASAAICALAEGKYFEFHEAAFAHELGYVDPADLDPAILEVGASIGLTSDAFRSCVEERRHLAAVDRSTREAAAAEIAYTPSVLINGLLIEGAMPIDIYRAKIDAALAEAAAATP